MIWNPSPTAFTLMNWPVRWYGLAYILGFWGAWHAANGWKMRFPRYGQDFVSDPVFNGLVFSSLIGGRLGYVFLYDPVYFWQYPWHILFLWEGGMAFHGALVGIIIFVCTYAVRYRSPTVWGLMDVWAPAIPWGLFWGRIANFVNQEVYGRVTDCAWGVIFGAVDVHPRHPSQIYEAMGEGIFLGAILLWAVYKTSWPRYPGRLTSFFLGGYGVIRFACEYFRVPDGVWMDMWTTGQMYSLPMIVIGFGKFARTYRA